MAEAGSGGGGGGGEENVRVMVRVRLFNAREIAESERRKEPIQSVVRMRDKTCVVVEHTTDERGFPVTKEREAFDFDECFWSIPLEQQAGMLPFADQKYVYDRSGVLALNYTLNGFNVCIFAYGQTGSGKTYSMLGAEADPGISPRLVDDIFAATDAQKLLRVTIECSFFEIYNEKVRDLFNKKASSTPEYDAPKIRQHPTKGVFVEGLLRKTVTTADMTKRLIEKGTKERAMAETKMNSHSSRSHAVFQIHVTQVDINKGTQKMSVINLIDLAGSEKVKQSEVKDQALVEAKNINQSLSTLRKVIDTMIENSKHKNKKHWKLPPYRESVLTYVLMDSLGGNSKTMMIATVSPHARNIEDSIGTLRYALRAKAIVCDAKVNEEQSKVMVDAMRDEILALQSKLRDGSGAGGGVMTAEIQEEIRMRESALEELETEQAKIKEELEEATRQRESLSTEIVVRRQERFATAFRNAFLIQTEKKKQETSRLEVVLLSRELTAVKTAYDVLQEDSQRDIHAYSVQLNDTQQRLAVAEEAAALHQDTANSLRSAMATLRAQHAQTVEANADLDTRVQRLTRDVASAEAALVTANASRTAAEAALDEERQRMAEERENLRKRKDKYKLVYMEQRARAEASQAVVDGFRSDRDSLLGALKAQQAVLEEHSSVTQRLATDKRDVERRERTLQRATAMKDQDIQLMGDALREYQSASTAFVYTRHQMMGELERLQRDNEAMAAAVEAQHRTASPRAHRNGSAARPSDGPTAASQSRQREADRPRTPLARASPMRVVGVSSSAAAPENGSARRPSIGHRVASPVSSASPPTAQSLRYY